MYFFGSVASWLRSTRCIVLMLHKQDWASERCPLRINAGLGVLTDHMTVRFMCFNPSCGNVPMVMACRGLLKIGFKTLGLHALIFAG